jgi:osmotically-inducible protein OsmY
MRKYDEMERNLRRYHRQYSSADQYAENLGNEGIIRQRADDFTGKGPKNYSRSDERILEEVCSLLTFQDSIDARNIEVRVESGYVFLMGEVDSRSTKKIAEACVENVSGVVDIQNQLKIK